MTGVIKRNRQTSTSVYSVIKLTNLDGAVGSEESMMRWITRQYLDTKMGI